jgi:hypothetical protein
LSLATNLKEVRMSRNTDSLPGPIAGYERMRADYERRVARGVNPTAAARAARAAESRRLGAIEGGDNDNESEGIHE